MCLESGELEFKDQAHLPSLSSWAAAWTQLSNTSDQNYIFHLPSSESHKFSVSHLLMMSKWQKIDHGPSFCLWEMSAIRLVSPGQWRTNGASGRCGPVPAPGGVKTDCSYHHMCTVWWGQGGLLAGLLCVAPSSIAPSDTPLGPILLCPLPSQIQAAVVILSFLPFPVSFIDSVQSKGRV